MRRTIGMILQVPVWLLIIGSIGGGFYAAYNKISGITYAAPIILSIVFVLYVLGRWLASSEESEDVRSVYSY